MPNSFDRFADIAWEDGDTPRSVHFDDPYFAREDGRAETRHVFLAANGLPDRWQDAGTFTIAELGFGTGLNFLETLSAWQNAPGQCQELVFVSFERYPLGGDDLARAIRPWPDLRAHVDHLLGHWPPPPDASRHQVAFGAAVLDLHLGDANAALPAWAGVANAWYLDGFSPAKNPELWDAALMRSVYEHTRPGGTFATYTAAGFVRRNLQAAGFAVKKIKGYGRKRESLAGNRG